MSNIKQQIELTPDDDRDFFELYVKDGHQKFVKHVRFLKAESLNEAEDIISEMSPNYWKTMSVRPVELDYIWETYGELHMSYMFCKSILGLL